MLRGIRFVGCNDIVIVALSDDRYAPELNNVSNENVYPVAAAHAVKSFAWDAEKSESLYLNAGEVTVTCEATSQVGKSSTFETTVTLKPTTRHTVIFDLSTAGNAKVNVTFDGEIVEVTEEEFELNENA